MQLKVVAAYRNRKTHYAVGEIITVSDADAAFLQADAPGCFEVYEAPAAKPAKPRTSRKATPNKMVKPDGVSTKKE